MGGRGASSGVGLSPLQAFRADAARLNQAKSKAMSEGATRLEYTDITGKKHTLFREGSAWRDKPNSMETAYREKKGYSEKTVKVRQATKNELLKLVKR